MVSSRLLRTIKGLCKRSAVSRIVMAAIVVWLQVAPAIQAGPPTEPVAESKSVPLPYIWPQIFDFPAAVGHAPMLASAAPTAQDDGDDDEPPPEVRRPVAPYLEVRAWARPDTVTAPGGETSILVEVANTGGITLTEVLVTVKVPEGETPVEPVAEPWIWDVDTRSLNWRVGALELGETQQATFAALVEGQAGDQIVNLVGAWDPALVRRVGTDARVGILSGESRWTQRG